MTESGDERRTAYDTNDVLLARAENEKRLPTNTINTPERQQLRRAVVEVLYGEGAQRKELRADLVLGPPAAGKSSRIAEPLRIRHGAIVIDADVAKEFLPEYESGRYAGSVHQESSDIADAIIGHAIVAGDNMVLPLIGKNPERVEELVRNLRNEGYAVYVHLNEVPLEKAAQRAISRFKETGRFVDPAYVLSIGNAPSITYNELKAKGLVNGYAKYSNDVEIGEQLEVLETSGPGTAVVGEA